MVFGRPKPKPKPEEKEKPKGKGKAPQIASQGGAVPAKQVRGVGKGQGGRVGDKVVNPRGDVIADFTGRTRKKGNKTLGI